MFEIFAIGFILGFISMFIFAVVMISLNSRLAENWRDKYYRLKEKTEPLLPDHLNPPVVEKEHQRLFYLDEPLEVQLKECRDSHIPGDCPLCGAD